MTNKSKPYKPKTIYTFYITSYIIVNPILNLLLNIKKNTETLLLNSFDILINLIISSHLSSVQQV